MIRIGIDVGGTNTDAVVMEGSNVIAGVKAGTTADVMSGVVAALKAVLEASKLAPEAIDVVMIGTTHFTNAVVQRRDLARTAAVRLGLPATASLPPMVDWPDDLKQTIGNHGYLAHGGNEFDGRVISPLDKDELLGIAADIKAKGINTIAITSVFSPVSNEFEKQAGEIFAEALPGAHITLSSEIGRIGLLERENAAIMNACLRDLSAMVIDAFGKAIAETGIKGKFFLTQNDGTLMEAEFAKKFPVLTFASGPTNSMRGAAFLSGVADAIVVDIGGTTSDVGSLHKGFPRQATVAVEVGGVRTNFRMPDVFSIGLGGGSLVIEGPRRHQGRPAIGRLSHRHRGADLRRRHAHHLGPDGRRRPCRLRRQVESRPHHARLHRPRPGADHGHARRLRRALAPLARTAAGDRRRRRLDPRRWTDRWPRSDQAQPLRRGQRRRRRHRAGLG